MLTLFRLSFITSTFAKLILRMHVRTECAFLPFILALIILATLVSFSSPQKLCVSAHGTPLHSLFFFHSFTQLKFLGGESKKNNLTQLDAENRSTKDDRVTTAKVIVRAIKPIKKGEELLITCMYIDVAFAPVFTLSMQILMRHKQKQSGSKN